MFRLLLLLICHGVHLLRVLAAQLLLTCLLLQEVLE
jgi:hypothetical protein